MKALLARMEYESNTFAQTNFPAHHDSELFWLTKAEEIALDKLRAKEASRKRRQS